MLDCYAANGQRILATVPARPLVTELLFLGTHTPVDTTASRLTAWRNSAMPPHAELWQLLLHEDSASKPRTAAAAAAAGVAACAWTPSQLFARLPRLARSLSTNRAYQLEQTKYLRRYYYMHGSLLLWNDTVGEAYPSYERIWRIEPDVFFSGSASTLIELSAGLQVDLLLPRYTREDFDLRPVRLMSSRRRVHRANETQGLYHHWLSHERLLRGVPARSRMRSLVSIGRYSRRFFDMLLRRYWSTGVAMYEEILLPVACATAGAAQCRMGSWSPGYGLPSVPLATPFRFRPEYDCEEFADALSRDTRKLFHPVKSHACLVEYLDRRGM